MQRDFTYIDDVCEGIIKLIDKIPNKDEFWDEKRSNISSSFAPYKIYNLGNNSPVALLDLIKAIERETGKKAKIVYKELQPSDPLITYADIKPLELEIGFSPKTHIDEGIKNFVQWYKEYYRI